MKKFKNFIFILTVFFCSTSVNCSEKIVYIDIDYVLNNSDFGKSIYMELEEINKQNISLLSSKEKIIKEKKENFDKTKNIASKEKINNDLNNLNTEIEKFRNEKNKLLNDFKLEKQKKLDNFLIKINPILIDYMKNNSIDIVLEKNQIFIGNQSKDITSDIINLINKNL